jgi:5-keto-L-gluconate epimerase
LKLSLYLSAPGSRFWTASSAFNLRHAIKLASRLGYDSVEIMPRGVDDPNPEELRAWAGEVGLRIAAIASGFIAVECGLTFTDPNADIRHRAVETMRRCIDAARRAGAPVVSVGVVRGKLRPGLSGAAATDYLSDCIQQCGRHARDRGVLLAVEPGNRYETDFIHTVDEGLALLGAVGLSSVRLMIDTFHMNIEERSIPDAIRRAGARLVHVHFADSNRLAPGWGHLDFQSVAAALHEIGYDNTIGMEMALTPDFEAAASQAARFVRALF